MITKDNAAQWLPLVRAMAEGKTIQVRGDMGGWFDVVSGCLTELRDGVARYRIKPEPKLRPWKAGEGPRTIVVKTKGDTAMSRLRAAQMCEPKGAGKYVILLPENADDCGHIWLTNEEIFTKWVRIAEDGTEHPCGVLCEGEEHGEA